MKQRRTKILALLLAATMTVGSPAAALTVSAEAEENGFSDVWETADSQEGEQFITDETPAEIGDVYTGEVEGTVDNEETGMDEIAGFFDGEEAGFLSGLEESATDELKNAEDTIVGKAYSATVQVLNSDGNVGGMYAMDSVIVTLQSDGTYLVRMHQTSHNREILALTDDPNVANSHAVPWYKGNGEDDHWFTIPLTSLNDTLHFCMIKGDYVQDGNVISGKTFSKIQTLTFDISSLKESTESPAVSSDINILPATVTEKADYTAVDAAIAAIPADLSVYTDESVAAVTAAKDAIVRDLAKDKQAEVDKMAENLNAAVKALVLKVVPVETTELAVTNTTGMFKVTKAVLQKSESGQKLLLTLSSTGYEYLFKGTYEDAVANGNNRDNWIKFEKTEAGYQFEIPVSDGETKLSLVSISKNKLKNYDDGTATIDKVFYPRQVVIDYSAKTLTAGDFDHTVSLSVDNKVKMFTISNASLHTVGGPNSNGYKETLELTMGSTSFSAIYVGSAEEAAKAESTIPITDKKASVLMKENATGGATILNYLEKPVVLSFYSVKNKAWYERVFTVSKKNGTVKVVAHKPATEVKLDVDAKELIEGESFDLTATVTPADTSDAIVWSSSDEKVATVTDGKVTAVGAGTAVITVTAGNVSANCTVTVVKKTFTYTIQALLANGTAQTKNITDVVATATDEEGNVVQAVADSKTMLEFEELDATKTYTIKVVRDGYYTVTGVRNGNQYTFTPTGEWEYTGKIDRKEDGNTVNVVFKKDDLKAALKEVPSDLSLYTAESAEKVKAAVSAADPDGKDFAKRDEQAAAIKAALNELKLVEDGEYLSEATVTNKGMDVLDLKIIVENGVAKARFIGSSKAYGKLFLGTSSAAKKAADDDPNMILPDNNGELVTSSDGKTEAYQFTMPISGFANEITFSSYATARKKWTQQTITFSSGKLQKYIKTTGIKLDQTETTLDAGSKVVLVASVEPANATYRDVTWTSSDEKVLTVAEDGTVTAVAEGKATITAVTGEFKAECQIAVHTYETLPAKAATCTRTGLTEGIKCSVCGEIIKAQEVIPALGHKEEILPAIAATCTKDGWSEGKKCSVCGTILKARKLVKATGHKEVVIPAVPATQGHTGLTEGKKCSVCGEILVAQKTIPALPILVTKVTLSAKTSTKIAAGKKVQLQVKTAPANAANKAVTWKSSNTKVATVNANGVVTMKKKAGGKSVVITATAKDGSKVYGSIKLTCTKGYVKKLAISGNKTVKAGKSLKLKAKVTATKNANKKVAWSSSNTKLATVSSNGVVKTFKGKKGTVKITVRSLDGTNKKATITIKIKK